MIRLTFLQSTSSFYLAAIIFILIIFFYLAGHSFRLSLIRKNPEKAKTDLGTINGTLLGLLGLLLAFTFSMSSSRYDERRKLVIEEANDIGTAILRADLYPDSIRRLFRNNFREYVEARIGFYQSGMDMDMATAFYLKADSISKELWNIAAQDARLNNFVLRSGQMIPALNAMIDITTTRRSAAESTVPDSIIYFLFILCFCSSFLLGYDNKGNIDWIMVIGLAIMLSFTVYSIIDLDRSRNGLINLDIPNNKIIELRELVKD